MFGFYLHISLTQSKSSKGTNRLIGYLIGSQRVKYHRPTDSKTFNSLIRKSCRIYLFYPNIANYIKSFQLTDQYSLFMISYLRQLQFFQVRRQKKVLQNQGSIQRLVICISRFKLKFSRIIIQQKTRIKHTCNKCIKRLTIQIFIYCLIHSGARKVPHKIMQGSFSRKFQYLIHV